MKKIIKTLLVVMVVVLALTALTACDKDEPETETPVCTEHTGGAATCTEAAKCDVCGVAYGEALGHTGGKATCTEGAKCDVCGVVYGEALGHTAMILPALDPTCSKVGKTEGECCRVCGKILVEQQPIDKVDHVWVENEDRDFTCTLDGFTGGKHCENCGIQDGTIVITPAHHIWGETYTKTEPTCVEAGATAHDCTVCGAKEKVEDIPAKGHSYDANGVCSVCGDAEVATLDQLTYALENATGVIYVVDDIMVNGTITLPAGKTLVGVDGAALIAVQLYMGDGSKVYDLTFYANSAENGSLIYAHDASVVIDGCVFVDAAWDAIQATTKVDNVTIKITNCEFVMNSVLSYRYIHIEVLDELKSAENNVKVVIGGNLFWNPELCADDAITVAGPHKANVTFAQNQVGTCASEEKVLAELWFGEIVDGAWAKYDAAAGVEVYSDSQYCLVTDDTCTTPSTCLSCGTTYGEALSHDYVNGICSVCEAKDPNYVDYYLVGYINGADYGCEGDYANLGEYKFVDGKLTVTFEKDSYVFVKTGNLAGASVKWYLFETYHGDKTEGTLYENKSEKMFIPGGVEIIFTLVVNEDGSLTLSYHKHAYEAVVTDPTCTAAGKTVYTCACGSTYEEAIDALGHADEDGDFLCDNGCKTVVAPEEGSTLTIAQAIALGKLYTKDKYTSGKYYVTGTVKSVYDLSWGNMYITDGTNELCVYGTYSADGATRYDKLADKPVAGDTITVYGIIGYYNAPQMKNGWITEHTHVHAYSEPTCTRLATCACGATTGELLDHIYTNGVCSCGDVDPDYSGTVESVTLKADFDTIAVNTSYGSKKSTSGWAGANCASVKVGDHMSLIMNGKTSAKGTITSPTLNNGVKSITFSYTNTYSESNGVDITIEVIQNGKVVASYKLDDNSVAQNAVETYTWVLDTAISGDFTIKFSNNSPSNNSSKNKDRVSIFDVQWTTNP